MLPPYVHVCRRRQGEEAATRITIPRLRVRRDWHAGLNPDHVDHRCAAG